MCGIQVLITKRNTGDSDNTHSKLWHDLSELNKRRGPDSQGEVTVPLAPDIRLQFGASVLHLRGTSPQPQPLTEGPSGDIFCWNGEVFGGLDIGTNNDSALLFQHLQSLKRKSQEYILEAFSRIDGPYAFAYYDSERQALWFARDYLGRRSLVLHSSPNAFALSSVCADRELEWAEVAAQKIYCVDLAAGFGQCRLRIREHCWRSPGKDAPADDGALVLPFGPPTSALARELGPGGPCEADFSALAASPDWAPYVAGLRHELTKAVETRVASIPAGARGAARVGVLFSGGVDCITIAAILAQVLPSDEAIELFNVAFENPRSLGSSKGNMAGTYSVPDRKTGVRGWRELQRIDPARTWLFVEVDVPYSETARCIDHIKQLIRPSDTVMDLSIGMALWFASRGRGSVVLDQQQDALRRAPYTGGSRVLFLGMGADEQLGGYSRHRAAWERGGHDELIKEISLDVRRISSRNLGRDDRVVSDHGRESRYPFLAANVVRYLSETPVNRKMDMRFGRGVGEKLLLRLVAYELGLVDACRFAKRAIQFGARTAKMETGYSKGNDRL